jgi:hypothetical protein
MIIADENINFAIIRAIRELKIEVYSIAESSSGISDSEVIALSLKPPRIIHDNHQTGEIISILSNLLSERLQDLANRFTPNNSPKNTDKKPVEKLVF